MITKLICWLLGHHNVTKAYTGATGPEAHFGKRVEYYVHEVQKFCLRCGKPNDDYLKIKEIKHKSQEMEVEHGLRITGQNKGRLPRAERSAKEAKRP